jgi:hypothetical protein
MHASFYDVGNTQLTRDLTNSPKFLPEHSVVHRRDFETADT